MHVKTALLHVMIVAMGVTLGVGYGCDAGNLCWECEVW